MDMVAAKGGLMLIVAGSDVVPAEAKGAVLAIGNFDGVHRGHQALIGKAVKRAAELGTRSGVVMFEPHPREVFHPAEPHFHLTPRALKLKRLQALGVDVVVILTFDRAFAALSANQFIEDVLVKRLEPRHIVIGYDFFFGKARTGTPETMRLAGQELGFGVTVVSPVAEGGEVFSSTAIRLKLAQGDVRGATQSLGDRWRVRGRVVSGAKRGTGLGYPTANIALEPGTALAHGIYAVWVDVIEDGQHPPATSERHMGAAYLGTRPTFDDGGPLLEVFLMDYDGDLYGREIEVAFVDFIRGDRRFDSVPELVAQMGADCAVAREILSEDAANS